MHRRNYCHICVAISSQVTVFCKIYANCGSLCEQSAQLEDPFLISYPCFCVSNAPPSLWCNKHCKLSTHYTCASLSFINTCTSFDSTWTITFAYTFVRKICRRLKLKTQILLRLSHIEDGIKLLVGRTKKSRRQSLALGALKVEHKFLSAL